MKKEFLIGIIFWIIGISEIQGQYSITGFGLNNSYTQNFDTFEGSSSSIPLHWSLTTSLGYGGFYNRSSSYSNTNGVFALRESPAPGDERSLGCKVAANSGNCTGAGQMYTDFIVANNTGANITGFQISWDIEQYSQSLRATTIDFSYQIGSGSFTQSNISGNTITTATTGSEGNLGAILSTQRSISISNLSITNGVTVTFRFTTCTGSGSGNNAHIGIDNFSFYAEGIPPCSPPSDQATNFTASNILSNQLDLNWTRGNGDNVLVVARAGNPVNTDPTNGTSYTANATFGSGQAIQPGNNYVVYNGNGTGVTVTGLSSGTTYHFAIYEYNDADLCYNLEQLTGNATTTTPTLSVSPTSMSGFTYSAGQGPSPSQSYSLSGVHLTGYPGNITVNGSANYEISLDDMSFSNSVNVPFTSPTLSATSVYVRLKAGLPAGNYNGQTVSNAGGGATTQNVTCNGTVTTPTISVTPATLTGFNYAEGSGPSASQSYSLSGTNLYPSSGSIEVSGTVNYEVSTDNVTFSLTVNLPYSGSNLSATSVYVRLKAGLDPANYNNEIVTNSGGGATTQNVTCSGSVSLSGPPPVVYSMGSGPWLGANMWNTQPNGGGVSVDNPSSSSTSIVIQSGHTIILSEPKQIADLSIENNASLSTNQSTNRYLEIYGSSIVINGSIGSPSDGLSFDINGSDCTLSGGGSINLSRLRKDNDSGGSSTTNLLIENCTVNLSWSTSGALYNNASAGASTQRTFNVTIASSATVNVMGDVVIDGASGTGVAWNDGTFTINGTLNIGRDLLIRTGNPAGGDVNYVINGTVVVDGQVVGAQGVSNGAAIANLTINNGGVLRLNGAAAVFTSISGSRDAFNLNSGSEVDYAGASTQFIHPFTYAKLTSSGGGSKNMIANITVNEGLNLQSGNIVAYGFTLTLGPSGTVQASSSDSYVETNSSGVFQRTVNTTQSIFPVGNTTYNPAWLTRSASSGIYNMRVMDMVLSEGLTGTPILQEVVNRTWDVTTDGAVGNLTLQVQWNASDQLNGFNTGSCFVAHYKPTGWDLDVPGNASGQNPYSRSRSDIMILSAFTVGSGNALPIELAHFRAVRVDNSTHLSWRTLSEINNEYFSIERSGDGKSFLEIGMESGAGFSLHPLDYEHFDHNPLYGTNYYRLRQVDYDGNYTYSPTVSVYFENEIQTPVIFPTVFNDLLTVQLPEETTEPVLLNFFDNCGRRVKSAFVNPGTDVFQLQTSELTPGSYFLKIQTGRNFFTEKLIKH